jgi:hypothetical protein
VLRSFGILTLIIAAFAFIRCGPEGHTVLVTSQRHKNRTFNMRQLPRPGQYTCDQALSVMEATRKLSTFAIGQAAKTPKESAGRAVLLQVSNGADKLYLQARDDSRRACRPS